MFHSSETKNSKQNKLLASFSLEFEPSNLFKANSYSNRLKYVGV